MMAREGLIVESHTLWDQIQALARHLEPSYEALGRRALATPVIHVDETHWLRLGSEAPAAGTVWAVATPTRLLSHLARQVGGRGPTDRRADLRTLRRRASRAWPLSGRRRRAGAPTSAAPGTVARSPSASRCGRLSRWACRGASWESRPLHARTLDRPHAIS
ncbi:MAG: transposase [Acidobacteria bacterium]|nr:transposase [Acidobacteriota bacterium]